MLMDKYDLFKDSLKKAAEKFRSIDKDEFIRIISPRPNQTHFPL